MLAIDNLIRWLCLASIHADCAICLKTLDLNGRDRQSAELRSLVPMGLVELDPGESPT